MKRYKLDAHKNMITGPEGVCIDLIGEINAMRSDNLCPIRAYRIPGMPHEDDRYLLIDEEIFDGEETEFSCVVDLIERLLAIRDAVKEMNSYFGFGRRTPPATSTSTMTP